MFRLVSRFAACTFFCTFILSCSSHLSFERPNPQNVDDDIKNIVALYQKRNDLNLMEKSIMHKMAVTFFTPIKNQLPKNKWQAFYASVMANQQSVERSLMDTYGKLLYGMGGTMFYATEMPHPRPTHFNVSQAGFANILYLNETSLNDKAEIEYIFEYSSSAIKQLFLSDVDKRASFQSKLDQMNDGFINVLLVSNESQRDAFGLNFSTAYSKQNYGFTSRHIKYNNWIESKYVNILYSVSFLHELVHSYIALNRMAIEDMQFDRNDYATIKNKLKTSRGRNIMLEEGLAEYVTRNYSVWSKLPIFEPVLSELRFEQKQGLPLLSLSEMERYYYGKEKRSFDYVQYGLLSAHALVDFLVQRYDIQTVVKLIDLEDIENNAERLLGITWETLMSEWRAKVLEQ